MSALPEIQPTRCVRYRFRYSECTRCEQACPHEAIRLSDEGVALDAEHCQACGLCVSACPTETFTTPALSPLALIEQARGRETLALACGPSGVAADVQVPCLGALAAPLLAYLLSQGTELQLVGTACCATCPHGERGAAQWAAHLDAVESLRVADRLGRWAAVALPQTAGRAVVAPSRSVPQPDADGTARTAARRGFFRRVANPAAAAPPAQPIATATAIAVPLRAIRAARPAPSAQRDLLQMLGLSESAEPQATHACLPAGTLRLDAGCTGCEACARACPTAALQVRENTSAWALGFEAGLCVACGVCAEACQPRVLHLADAVPAAHFAQREPQALHQMPKRRCTRCDRSYVIHNDKPLCEVCAGDEEDFDAIFG